MSVVWLRLHLRLRSLLFDFSYMRVLCGSAVRLLSFFCCLLFAPHVGAFASVEATTPRTPFSIICKINLHTSIFCSTFAVGNRKPRRAVLHIFYPPRVVYLIRLIVIRISNKRKTNTKIAFFIVFSVSLFLLCTIRRGASARVRYSHYLTRFAFILDVVYLYTGICTPVVA